MMTMRLLLSIVAIIAAVFSWMAYTAWAPDRYDITAPIDLTDKPTFITELKLRLASPDICYEALHAAGVFFERLPDEIKGANCRFRDVARLDRSAISWGGGITLRCQMLTGLAMWERHTLQPAAAELFGSQVVRIQHYGTYSCRNVNGAARGRRSEHAFANAVDVAGFVLDNGDVVSVLRDWGADTPKGAFLGRIHAGACRQFNTVLGPDYNRLHRDHFHFDNGDFASCA